MVHAGGQIELFDMLHPKSGIGEQFEASAENPGLIERIRTYLRDHPDTPRYHTLPDQP